MGNITQAERDRRLAESVPNANNSAVEGSDPMTEYEAAMARWDPEDPTRLKPIDPTDPNYVTIRVLPKGDGKISKGINDRSANNFPFHKKNDRLRVPRSVAEAQENNGYAEIIEDDN